jgi:hypothetical protein
MKVINNYGKPINLDDGTILAASGTNGSMREGIELSDRDQRRYVKTGLIAVIETPAKEAEPRKKEPK